MKRLIALTFVLLASTAHAQEPPTSEFPQPGKCITAPKGQDVKMACIGGSTDACHIIIKNSDVTSALKATTSVLGIFTYQAVAGGTKVCHLPR